MKILIRNLSRVTTEDEIEALFAPFGAVQSCDLVTDAKTNQSKGFGFVEMPDEQHANRAIKELNGKTIASSRIRVKLTDQ